VLVGWLVFLIASFLPSFLACLLGCLRVAYAARLLLRFSFTPKKQKPYLYYLPSVFFSTTFITTTLHTHCMHALVESHFFTLPGIA
jgi:hypothetical protein